MSGVLPPQLSKLSLMQDLRIFRNAIGGTLSESFFQAWTAMTRLDLSYMQLSGTLPPTVAFMSSIDFLSLSNNSFTGPVPSSLGGLAASGVLTSLALDGNSFAGTLDPRLLSLLGICTSASAASVFGSPNLAYACPGAPAPSPASSSAALGWDVIGPIILGGALLLIALLVVAWHFRSRRRAPLSSSIGLQLSVSASATPHTSRRPGASEPGSPARMLAASISPGSGPPTASSGPGATATPTSPSARRPWGPSAVVPSASDDSGQNPGTGDLNLLWQCDFHRCGVHDVYLW